MTKTIGLALMLLLMGSIGSPLRAAPADACKVCRDQQKACVQAHSRAACTTEYEVCMRHCRRK
jgi:hypothetical protein